MDEAFNSPLQVGFPPVFSVEKVPSQNPVDSPSARTVYKGKSTPEQRERWRRQKQVQRNKDIAMAGGLPPPLPPMAPGGDGQPQAEGVPVADSPQPEDVPLVPWAEDEVKDVVSELIGLLEDWDKADSLKRARVAKLGGELLRQIETDAEIPKFCKAVFQKYLPRMLAKYLNQSGPSSKWKDEGAMLLAALYYAYDKLSRNRTIAKLAAERPPEAQPA